ncbi:DNA repair protein RecN [Altericista sp. CCNU0014]|uniref:DNA repair protein RecN n=1 Tax=Altericista sp. CCNU0014 TaxID=3082949 RepID=UPI0038512C38
MLVSLRIENFALIDRLDLTFGSGLNVLTGETGAGKSIILDALDLALGGKAHSRTIRMGSTKTFLEASFQLSDRLRAWLAETEIDPLEDPVLICSREVSSAQGTLRSRSRVNGVLVNKQQMESLRDRLVEITAQGQTLQLGQPALQRDWLDAFGGKALLAQRQLVADAFQKYQTAQQQLDRYRQTAQQRLQQIDGLNFQRQELSEADLRDPEEQTQLTHEYQRLSHSVELQAQSSTAYQLLYDSPQASACTDLLGKAVAVLEDMSAVDPQVQPISDLVQEALAQVQEAGTQIHRYGDSLETDPQRLQEVEVRLQQLKQICRKYGPTLTEAIAHQVRIEAELEALTGEGQSLEALEQASAAARTTLIRACEQLTALRQPIALDLETRLIRELKPLAMEKVQFCVQIEPMAPTAHGADRITFVFSPNPGEPLQPLAETASGGEMSRFLLALKACFSQIDPVATFVFDEVDVGVSGRVAQAIAEKLHHLSQTHQILCVTHQPIIAAIADRHFRVEKTIVAADSGSAEEQRSEPRTAIRIQSLDERERPLELAQLAGGSATDQVLAFAASLLAQADQIRNPSGAGATKTKASPSRARAKAQKRAS